MHIAWGMSIFLDYEKTQDLFQNVSVVITIEAGVHMR